MKDIIYDYLSPQQYCSAALIVTNGTLDVLSESVSDLSTLALNHVVKSEDIINLYDPINDSLSDFTTYSASNGQSVLCSLKQMPRPEIAVLDAQNIVDEIKYIFDFTDNEITELGIFGCLRIAREVDPTKTNIRDLLKSCVYLPSGYDFTSIWQALRDMDRYAPTYAYTFIKVYDYTDELSGLRDAVLSGDFSLGEFNDAMLLASGSYEIFKDRTNLSDSDIVAILLDQQWEGFPYNTVLQCINYRYAKKYQIIKGDSEIDFYIYKQNGDVGQFRTMTFDLVQDSFTEMVREVSEESAAQSVLQKALYLAASGESKVADLASYLGQGFDSSFGSTKNLISTISSYGSSMNSCVSSAVKSLYQSITTARPVDGNIEWGQLQVPTYDATMGSVIVGVACTAAQAIGTMMVAFGGMAVKLAGAIVLAGSFIVQGISSLLADVADTYPDFKSDTIDRLFGYPLFQRDGMRMNHIPLEHRLQLKKYGSIKIFYPWCVIFIYNYQSSNETADVKIFVNATQCSSRGYGISAVQLTRLAHFTAAPKCIVTPPSGGGNAYGFSAVKYDRNALMDVLIDAYRHSGTSAIATVRSKPCTPEYYNVHSKDSSDYIGLWSVIAQNAALTLLMFKPPYFETDGAAIGLRQETHQLAFNNVSNHPEWLFDVIMLYTFGNLAENDSYYSNWLQDLMGTLGVNLYFTLRDPEPAEFIVNYYLPWISSSIGDIGSNFMWNDDRAETLGLLMPWSGFDQFYAITPPKRSLASLIWAVIVTAAVIIGSVVTFTVLKRLVSRKLQPIWFNKVKALQKDAEALSELQVNTADDARAYKLISRDYFKRVRKFNLISGLLGMGTYNVMADWYEGSGTIGGTWSQATGLDTTSAYNELQSGVEANGTLKEALIDSDTGKVVTLKQLKEDIAVNEENIEVLKRLIRGV